jgi:sulfite oxidase
MKRVARSLKYRFKGSEETSFNPFPALQLAFVSLVALGCKTSGADCEEEKIYRTPEIQKHKTKETGIWVTYKDGVYDITKFIPNHPGGRDKIMMAAGQDIEPFWNVYRQHYNSPLPQELLKEMRIGTLHPEDRVKPSSSDSNENNPFRNDPILSPVLKYLSKQPINAEAPGFLLTDSWITPIDLWFVRNHHPVPRIDENNFKLEIVFACDVLGRKRIESNMDDDQCSAPLASLTLEDLKTRFPRTSVVTSIQCGGNRRSEMTDLERTNGASWDISAMSTAKWTGVRLRDLLQSLEITEDSLFDESGNPLENNPNNPNNPNSSSSTTSASSSSPSSSSSFLSHVQFVGAEGMEASIPIKKALNRFGDVVLAYEMNDRPLPVQHGFPLRAIVPGHVGVRNVKWLSKIRLSGEEAHGPWQRGMAYKGFSPSVRSLEGIDVEAIPSLQEQPVTSAIASPVPFSRVSVSDAPLVITGYSYSGGGRGIVRVDVSIDGGKNWKTADLLPDMGSQQPMDRAWAWTLWQCDFDLPENLKNTRIEVIAKATDSAYNCQPDSVRGIWNLRGINNNAWHRVPVDIVEEEKEEEEEEPEE